MLEQRIRALVNEIVDPCSSAQALPIGLVDMGLLLAIELMPAGEAASGQVDVRLRLRTRIGLLPEVAALALDWDGAWDWTIDDIAPAPREALAERRRRLLAPSASVVSELRS